EVRRSAERSTREGGSPLGERSADAFEARRSFLESDRFRRSLGSGAALERSEEERRSVRSGSSILSEGFLWRVARGRGEEGRSAKDGREVKTPLALALAFARSAALVFAPMCIELFVIHGAIHHALGENTTVMGIYSRDIYVPFFIGLVVLFWKMQPIPVE